jgi:ribosome-binding factor A
MALFRIEKVNNLIQEEVSKLIAKEVDFEGYIVTVTRVETTRNLGKTDVLITVLPEEKEKDALLTLKKSVYDIQKILNKKLRMKYVPKLYFKIDEGLKNLYKIDRVCK